MRILLGSTEKMGTGTNVQTRLVALHHLDAPWKPAQVEQRDGRILRQKNMNAEVWIYRYVTQGSFDAYLWQALETKARFIAQVLTGDRTVRQAEDIGAQELSYAEVKAIASGNPAVLSLAEADAELQRLHVLQKHHADEQYLARRQLRALPAEITRLERRVAALTQDMATVQAHAADPLTIGTRTYRREDALEALTTRLQSLPALVYDKRTVALGQYRGLRFGLVQHPQGAPEVYIEGTLTRYAPLSRELHGPRALLNAVERLISTAASERDKAARDLSIAQGQLCDYAARLGTGFAHAAYLEALTGLRHQLEAALSSTAPEGVEAWLPTVGALVERLKALKAAHTLDAATATVRPMWHGYGRRGHHHAHSPAGADRGRAPAGGRAGAAVPGAAHTAACHRAGASGQSLAGRAPVSRHADLKHLLGFLPSWRAAQGGQAQRDAMGILDLAHPVLLGQPEQ